MKMKNKQIEKLTRTDILSIKLADSDFRNKKTKILSKLSWSELTEPLRKAKKKIREEDVVELVHRMRKEK